ncbi:MAG: hypothetical protein V1901_00925 [Patescibacteria group bacterium]
MGEDHCKCWAWKLVVIGILVLAWNWYITGMGSFFAKDWPTFIGVLLVIKGILKSVKPTCCNEAKPEAKKKK